MESHRTYDPEAATNLYAELQEAYNHRAQCREAYLALNRTFQKCLNEHTRFAGIRFGGAFAKADYLLKACHAPRRLQRSLNDARVRLRKMRQLPESDQEAHFPHDFKAVCQFVALVYQVPVPSFIEAVFPDEDIVRRGDLKADSLRVVVDSWDDAYIHAEADVEGIDEVKIFYGGISAHSVYSEWDWSYLASILKKGSQLNLVRPREIDGVLYPELFVFEPDFLVDISAIAACFEQYGVTPLNHLLGKLKPSTSSQPILLGHLASQFLDEGLYSRSGDRTYVQSVQQFFKRHALDLLATPLSRDFHAQAQSQQQIIMDTLQRKLPEVLQAEHIRVDSSEIMVEPSFFSEMLGLQGRMDFLQLDQKVVIEQKSGKAGFPESDPPKQQEKHYVQLLLYMSLLRYNFHDTYQRNNRSLHAFLLYSKYASGLLPLGFSPRLVFAAMKLRNEIAASEYAYTREGFSVLTRLTADALNINNMQGTLWEKYQKVQIEALLQPIHQASALEQAYYLRFLKFIATEHLMAKVGNSTKENSGFADKWLSSLDDKLLAGNIYFDLELLSPSEAEAGKVDQVVLRFAERPEHEISNFRVGDIVILYPHNEGEEPDARRSMVFRSTIEKFSADSITLRLRSAQTDAHVFWHEGHRKWAIEHDFLESSFSALYRGLHAFLSAPKERKDLLLLQRRPAVDKTLTLTGDYGAFNTLSLKARQAKDLFLIIGPPGTGKTSYGLLNTLREHLASTDDAVLLMSYTNRAVDEICGKLLESGIDFIRIGGNLACDESYRGRLLGTIAEQCVRIEQLRDIIASTRVFVGTTTSLNSNIQLFKLKRFGLAIIDEASQILEPHLAGLLSATANDGTAAIAKMILIGDHKQLPAVVQQSEEESVVAEPALKAIHLTDCRLSLFERLLRRYRDDEDVTYMLTKQGRMHHDIALFPNYSFYQNRLEVVPLEHQEIHLPPTGKGENGMEDLLLTRRLAFVAIPPAPHSASDKVNSNEARAIAATVAKIHELHARSFSPTETVGVIVPYRNQISEIRNCLETFGIPALRDITIDTVERFQGSQRDYIVYGFTIQKYYQLDFLTSHVFEEDGSIIDRKLNVAMTRAREHLLLFGNPQLLANNITFYKLMAFARSKHGYFSVPLDDYIAGRFTVHTMSSEPVLPPLPCPPSASFEKAFGELVLTPVWKDKASCKPDLVMGRDMQANLEAIGYGRQDIGLHPGLIPPKEQVLLYCHYYMREHYGSSKTLFASYKQWMEAQIQTYGGRVQFIDIGCGPATGGIAFFEEFGTSAQMMTYVGIDISKEMRTMAEKFLTTLFGDRLRCRWLSTYDELTDHYWASVSELPTLVVFNFSYVFPRLSAQKSERLAQSILRTMQKHPLNKYAFFVEQTECDTQLNTLKVFKSIVSSSSSPFFCNNQ